MFKIYDAYIIDESTMDNGYVTVQGQCAWSVKSCMLDGDGTYYNKYKDSQPNATNLLIETTIGQVLDCGHSLVYNTLLQCSLQQY